MTRVICDMSMSLDGYVTGPNDSRENPFGDGAELLHGWISDAATDEDRAILQDVLDSVGAVVMGRTSFDKNEGEGGWGDGGPLGDTPCFVVTHHEPTGPTRRSSPSSPTAWPSRSSRPSARPATRSSTSSARLSCSRRSRSAWSTRSACT